MALPAYVLRFWHALDALFADVRPTTWGAVVTDGRFPRIWDANYARVDVAARELGVHDIERELLPALRAVGADTFHVVTIHPGEHRRLLTDLSSRGHRLTWDLVMQASPGTTWPADGTPVEELARDDVLWERVSDSIALFGVEPGDAIRQLRQIESDVLSPGGKRWFGVRDADGRLVSLAALLVLEGVGYIDNVATFPEARGRGYASAITARLVAEASEHGAEHVCLFADPDDDAVIRLYGKLGFTDVGRVGATRGPLSLEGDEHM